MRTLAILLNCSAIGLAIYMTATEGGPNDGGKLLILSILGVSPIVSLLVLFRAAAVRTFAILLNCLLIGFAIFAAGYLGLSTFKAGPDFLLLISLIAAPSVSLLAFFIGEDNEPATAQRIFIVVTALCGVFFGFPFLYLLYRLARVPWYADARIYWDVSHNVFSYNPVTEAYMFGIATLVPPLVTYLDWDSKKRKARQNFDAQSKTAGGLVSEEKPSTGPPPESPEQPKPPYLVSPPILSRAASPPTPKSPPDPMRTPLIVGLCTCVIIVVGLLIWATFSKENHQSKSITRNEPNTSQKTDPYVPEITGDLELPLKMQKAGRLRDAIEIYSECIRKNPKSAEAYNWRGIAYDDLSERDKAFQDFSKAVEINPNYADAYNNRGEIYCKKKMYREAFTDYRTAVRLQPTFAEAHYNIGLIAELEKKPGPAVAAYENYLKFKPSAPDRAAIEAKIKTLGQSNRAGF